MNFGTVTKLQNARQSDKPSLKNDALEYAVRIIEKMEEGYDLEGAEKEIEEEDSNAE